LETLGTRPRKNSEIEGSLHHIVNLWPGSGEGTIQAVKRLRRLGFSRSKRAMRLKVETVKEGRMLEGEFNCVESVKKSLRLWGDYSSKGEKVSW